MYNVDRISTRAGMAIGHCVARLGRTAMKRIAAVVSVVVLAFTFVRSAKAQNDVPVVPVLKAPYHLPVFKNEYVTMANIYIPPGGHSGYHKHTGESVSVNVEEADMLNQELGDPDFKPAPRQLAGHVNYIDYRPKPRIHQVVNAGPTAFHNILLIFDKPTGLAPSSRADVPSYQQVLDNHCARAWSLKLDPGQSVAAITQQAPGIRVIVKGGQIVESVPGQPDRPMNPKLGEFYWQEAGVTRSIRNIGNTPVEFVEFELK
jgi:hypothetical protein